MLSYDVADRIPQAGVEAGLVMIPMQAGAETDLAMIPIHAQPVCAGNTP